MGRVTRVARPRTVFVQPSGCMRETEHYSVTLAGVTDLELGVVPDLSGRPVVAR